MMQRMEHMKLVSTGFTALLLIADAVIRQSSLPAYRALKS
jgi:hypothetical protein